MKTLFLKNLTKTIFLGTFILIMLFSFDSQAKRIHFSTSSIVPAARGYVKINKDKNRNYAIKVVLYGLAEVQRLEPSKLTYVVWMITDQEITKNIGQLKSSSSLLSKKLKASFETVSSFKPEQVFITAEDDESIQYPGTQVVISTDRF